MELLVILAFLFLLCFLSRGKLKEKEITMNNSNLPPQGVLPNPKGPGPTGVGGWLAFRILIYLVYMPLAAIYYASQSPIPVVIGLEVVFTCWFVVAGVLLWRLDALGVKFAKIGEAANIVIGLLCLFADPAVGLQCIVGGSIWLAYFFVSKRVKDTYFPQRGAS
jgi:hypothetical protein